MKYKPTTETNRNRNKYTNTK